MRGSIIHGRWMEVDHDRDGHATEGGNECWFALHQAIVLRRCYFSTLWILSSSTVAPLRCPSFDILEFERTMTGVGAICG